MNTKRVIQFGAAMVLGVVLMSFPETSQAVTLCQDDSTLGCTSAPSCEGVAEGNACTNLRGSCVLDGTIKNNKVCCTCQAQGVPAVSPPIRLLFVILLLGGGLIALQGLRLRRSKIRSPRR
jgi:hypothetical protein